MAVALTDPLTVLTGVGPKQAATLGDALQLHTIRDLIEHYPRRYQDLGEVLELDDARVGEAVTLVGTVLSWDQRFPQSRGKGRRLTITEGRVQDQAGGVFTVTFFNQTWRASKLPPNTIAAFSGKLDRFNRTLKLTGPEVQVVGRGDGELDLDHQRLVPVYPATEAVPTWKIGKLIEQALGELPTLSDPVPEHLLDEHDLIDLDQAIRTIHAPADPDAAGRARRRLVFDELFTLQLGLQWRRHRLEADLIGKDNTPQGDGRAATYLESLPFAPTGAQERAFDQLGRDLADPRPMHRLLQGDVGSGKTLVAAWALLCAVDNGRQGALMVPTEVLAEQHYRTLLMQLQALHVNVMDGIRVGLLTSSTTAKKRREMLSQLLTGELNLVVGTHALLEEGVRFADLGVVVIDEQHRFGVAQRVQLKSKGEQEVGVSAGLMPDVLVMTATPIPRSLALTLYGDLDVTVLDELPPGRTPIVTQLITPRESKRRERLYDFVREQAAEGLRTYVVCPLVEDSEALQARSAEEEHKRLATDVFPDLHVELIHGRMRSDDKEEAMRRFREGEAQVLVATTVIEVGVDVPEAAIMIIENAERFGISQLHQLRGRVGRGAAKSYCVLFTGDEVSADAELRLAAVAETTDGFVLAEKDLEIRGEGQLFGQKQSGLPDLKLARLVRDGRTVSQTRDAARLLVAGDPDLTAPGHATLRAEILRRFQGGLEELEALETG